MERLIRGVLNLSLVLLCLAGCQSVPPNPWQTLPPPPQPLTHAAPVWEQIRLRRQALDNLRGLARAQLQVATRQATIENMALVQQRFTSLRLEGLGPLNQPLFLLIADAQQLALYAPQEGRLLTGAASAENMARLFGIAVTPLSLQYVLAGDVPLSTLPTDGALRYTRRENLYLWQGQAPGQPLTYRLWFEPYDFHPVRCEVEDLGGQVVLQIWYEQFRRFDGVMMPYRLVLAQPKVGRRVVWEYQDLQRNSPVPPGLFQLRPPAGVTRVAIEDLLEPEADRLPRIW